MIKEFRKRPVEVAAVLYDGENFAEVSDFTEGNFRLTDETTAQVYDELHTSWINVTLGQWIICGVHGEFYPIAPDVLLETYEEVEEV